MTNFEITHNLFKNLNKFEQREIVKQYIDGIFDEHMLEPNRDNKDLQQGFETKSDKDFVTNINQNGYNIVKKDESISVEEWVKNVQNNVTNIYTNFFEIVDKVDAIILTDDIHEVNELCELFYNAIPNGKKYKQKLLTEENLNNSAQLGFYLDEYILDFGHITYYVNNDYKTISFKDFKKHLNL